MTGELPWHPASKSADYPDIGGNWRYYSDSQGPQSDEVAAVLTYVRSRFGQSAGSVSADQVRRLRDRLRNAQ